MKRPKFQIGQKVWCFNGTGCYSGIVRVVAFTDMIDNNCDKFEYDVLIDLLWKYPYDIERFKEEALTADPLTAQEIKRLKIESQLNSMNATIADEVAHIGMATRDLKKRKEQLILLEHRRDALSEAVNKTRKEE